MEDNNPLINQVSDYIPPKEKSKSRNWLRFGLTTAAVIIICLLVITVSFAIGYLIGWNRFASVHNAEKTAWGNTVSVDGRSVPINQWISNKLIAEHIKQNLK